MPALSCCRASPGASAPRRREVDVRITPGVADITEALDTRRADLTISGHGRVPERLSLRELLRDRLVWVLPPTTRWPKSR